MLDWRKLSALKQYLGSYALEDSQSWEYSCYKEKKKKKMSKWGKKMQQKAKKKNK